MKENYKYQQSKKSDNAINRKTSNIILPQSDYSL